MVADRMKVLRKHEKQISDLTTKLNGKVSDEDLAGRIAVMKADHTKELLSLDKKLLHEVRLMEGMCACESDMCVCEGS